MGEGVVERSNVGGDIEDSGMGYRIDFEEK